MGLGPVVDPMNHFSTLQSASGCSGRHYTPGSGAQLTCHAPCPIRRMAYAGASGGNSLRLQWQDLEPALAYTNKGAFPGLRTPEE